MSMITGTLKSLLVIKLKGRHDSFTDQFNRIFMVKMSMVSAFLLGMNWFKDTITCIIPSTAGIDKGFVAQACWIQGFYVYKELKRVPGVLGYYGIPNDLNKDGYRSDGSLCKTPEQNCEPFTKTFYLQYQWFPFYIAVIGFLYYLPYIVFRFVNVDLMTLKTSIKAPEVDIDGLVKNYFNYQVNPPMRMRIRLLGNIAIKLLYLLVNVLAFTATNSLINGDFKNYGNEWIGWSKGTNQEAYDYTANRRNLYKPGEALLPTFGFCEVLELGKDIKHTLFNTHRFVCEISQNVLYQYVLILLWFLFIFGMVISAVGLILKLVDQVLAMNCALPAGSQARRLYQTLTYREIEYLEFIRKKKLIVFGKLVRKLADERLDRYPTDNYSPVTDPTNPYAPSQKLLEEAQAQHL